MRYLGIDPGLSTGWALVNEIGAPLDRGITRSVNDFVRWIDDVEPVDVIVYEDFRLFGHKAVAQTGSKMEASQIIGLLKLIAKQWGAELIGQNPGCHKLGAAFSGKKEGAHRDSHDIVAYNHVFYYLVSNNKIKMRGREIVNPRMSQSE